jgi:hypothetical protein
MFALIRMDWTLNRRLIFQLTPLWLLYGGYIFLGGTRGILGGCVMFPTVLGLLLMFSELGSPIMPFVCALPVSRSRIVMARYLSALLTLTVGLVIPVMLGFLGQRLGWGFWKFFNEIPASSMADVPALLILIALAFSTVIFLYFPFHFRFGAERGLQIFIILDIVALATWTWLTGWDGVQRMHELAGQFLDNARWRFESALVVLLLGGISLLVSVQGFKQRSF